MVRQIIVVLLLISLAFSLLALTLKSIRQKETYVTVELIASGGNWWETIPRTPSWLIDSLTLGDIEYSTSGKKIAEILEIKKYEEDFNKIAWVRIKLLVIKNDKLGSYRFRQQPLEIGSSITINPANIKLSGNVIAIEGKSPPMETRRLLVTVQLYDKRPWFAEKIHVGDVIADDQSNFIARINNKTVSPSQRSIFTSDGKLLLRTDPQMRDIVLELEIQVTQRGGINYFNQVQPVKVGNKLWIPFKEINVYEANIIEIRSEQ